MSKAEAVQPDPEIKDAEQIEPPKKTRARKGDTAPKTADPNRATGGRFAPGNKAAAGAKAAAKKGSTTSSTAIAAQWNTIGEVLEAVWCPECGGTIKKRSTLLGKACADASADVPWIKNFFEGTSGLGKNAQIVLVLLMVAVPIAKHHGVIGPKRHDDNTPFEDDAYYRDPPIDPRSDASAQYVEEIIAGPPISDIDPAKAFTPGGDASVEPAAPIKPATVGVPPIL